MEEINILEKPDSFFNEWFSSFSKFSNVSKSYKRGAVFFFEYYKNARKKLSELSFDDFFEKEMFEYSGIESIEKEKQDEVKLNNSIAKECEIAYDKLYLEIVNHTTEEKSFTKEQFNNNEITQEEFLKLVELYFSKNQNKRFTSLIKGLDDNSNLYPHILQEIAKGLYTYKVENNNLEIGNSSKLFLCKYSRLLNLEAKMAHTSRMLYMANSYTNNMDNKLRELVLLSVMYHDVGRFYQAIFYPDFFDRRVGKVEEKKELKSHAEVGYYFPIQTLIAEDLIKCNGNIDESLVMHTLMAMVTKLHQTSNEFLSQYDVDYSNCNLDSSAINELIPLIKKSYQEAPIINFKAKYEVADNIQMMENQNIEMITGIVKTIISISEYMKHSDMFDESHKELKERIDRFLRQFFSKERLEELYKDPSELTKIGYLEEMFHIKLPEDFKIELNNSVNDIRKMVTTRFKAIEERLLDKDFAQVLDNALKSENEQLPSIQIETLRKVLGAAMTITTDLDKIDIINQRINGSWEKTNGSIYKRSQAAINSGKELTSSEIVDSFCRNVFYSHVGEEPKEIELDQRTRGYKIIGSAITHPQTKERLQASKGNKIRALWFQLDQFITVNMRNYNSFKYIKENDLLSKMRNQMVSLQEGTKEELKIVTALIDEPINFCKTFIDNILTCRVDENGKLTFNGEGRIPTTFTKEQIYQIRNITVDNFMLSQETENSIQLLENPEVVNKR